MSKTNEYLFAVLLIALFFSFKSLYLVIQRKEKYQKVMSKRNQRIVSRKAKAERLAKYGPPGLLEQAICGMFDIYIEHTFHSSIRKKS